MKWTATAIALLTFLSTALFTQAQDPQSPQALCDAAQPNPPSTMTFPAPEQILDPDTDYRAIFCTSAGPIYVDLYESQTPITVNNFLFLAQQSYYDSTTFHRVIPDFMAQGGDPTGTGRGGPGYQFQDEPIGYLRFHRPFLLAMANAGPNTNGSQFFITTAPTPHLDNKHTIFGEVLLGQDTVTAIKERDPSTATTPGETLHTILIITDPTTIDSPQINEQPPATQEEIIAAFDRFGADVYTLATTGNLQRALPAEHQEAFAAFAENYSHQYRYAMRFENAGCAKDVFYDSIGYRIDVFADSQSAQDALNDPLLPALATADGFSPLDSEQRPFYTKDAPSCYGDGARIMTQYTIGRYLISADVHMNNEALGDNPQTIMQSLANQMDSAFFDIYPREIRS